MRLSNWRPSLLSLTITSFAMLCLVVVTPDAAATTQDADESELRDLMLDKGDPAMRFLARHLAFRRTSAVASARPGADVALGGYNEVTVVVNPTDPLNIASASVAELRVSTDGGLTWAPAVPPEVPSTHASWGDPSLAFDSQGRLFWSYIGAPLGTYTSILGLDLFVAECDPVTGTILPGYPVNVTAQIGLPGSAGDYHDKEWLAADHYGLSPFADNLYLVWTQFPAAGGTLVLTSASSDHGVTWSPAVQLGGGGTAYKWPSHVTVAPNGDVYVADHRQLGYLPLTDGLVPDGVSGRVRVFRSTDGGTTFAQSSTAYAAGDADMTWNLQAYTGNVPDTDFLTIGSVQPWVLADPNVPGRVYVVASDDPDNDVTSGDAADVFIVHSTDHGLTWSAPRRVDSGPGTTFQVMPTASIDPVSGAIVVHYYDTRHGALNGNGNLLLDVFAAVSLDGGMTFGQDFQINDAPFDPDAGARCWRYCGPSVWDVWAGPDSAYAVTDSGRLLVFDGTSWTEISTGVPLVPKWAIWGSSSTDVFLCGDGGEILHYDGVQVTTQASGTTEHLYGMDGRGAGDVWCVGANGTILHYDGLGWSPITSGTTAELHDVWANPTGDVFVVGRNGTVLRCSGGSCSSIGPLLDEDLSGVWGASDSSVYAVSWTAGLYHFTGTSWDTLDSGLDFLSGIWGSSASDIIATGWGQLLRFDGTDWSRESASEHLAWKIHGSDASNIFAVGEHTFIGHYDGSMWSVQDNPLAPLSPTLRIGEYNGVDARGGTAVAVWCGNTLDPLNQPLDQQAFFDTFTTGWQVGISAGLVDAAGPIILEPGAPNPFRQVATFAYSVPRPTTLRLSLHDVSGRLVTVLADGPQPAGRHEVRWAGHTAGGAGASAGVYFLRLQAGGEVRTQKVVLAR